jgi:hypothetical protein
MLDKVKIKDKEYYSINLFMIITGLKSRRSVYAWVDQGKADKKKIGSNSFFAKL